LQPILKEEGFVLIATSLVEISTLKKC